MDSIFASKKQRNTTNPKYVINEKIIDIDIARSHSVWCLREVYPIWLTNVVTPQYYRPEYYISYAVGYGRTPAAIAVYNYQ